MSEDIENTTKGTTQGKGVEDIVLLYQVPLPEPEDIIFLILKAKNKSIYRVGI